MTIKEKIIRELKKGPIKYKKLIQKFKSKKKFFSAIERLYNEGIIDEVNGLVVLVEKNKKEKSKSYDTDNLYRGTVIKLTEKFGFVRVENDATDIFVSGRLMMGAVPGDEVLLQKIDSKSRQIEGKIVEIVKEKKNLIATITYKRGNMYATLMDCKYVTMRVENHFYALEGDIVVISVIGRGHSHRDLTCRATYVIGKVSTSKKATEVVIASKEVEVEFTKKLLDEANEIIKNVDFEAEAAKREDLTDLDIFTIDSRSTKDIDDAIHIKKTTKGYELGVHIADVSYFIKGGTECDLNAYRRGTSIYYGNKVIPMLPPVFSNDLCSLNENTKRLAFSCFIQLDNNANLLDYRFVKTVIKSRVKGVYSEINSLLDNTRSDDIKQKYSKVNDEIVLADELFSKLRDRRIERGYMDIESDEAYIVFDEMDTAVDVKKRVSGRSEQIIEEFMILANQCAAKFGKKHNLPFIYRIHEKPSDEKLETLTENLTRMNLVFNAYDENTIHLEMGKILDETRDTPLETTVHRMILRAQSKAKYSEKEIPHFSLALSDYSHFTSPIRRYSDLAIHRIMSDYLSEKDSEYIQKRYGKFAPARAKQASDREIIATQIERATDDIYKAEIMQAHKGESFIGVVTSVKSFGIYVMLENTAEGLVHVSLLDMVQPTVAEGYSLSCPYTGRKYTVGDTIAVKIIDTDILNGNIDMDIDRENPVHNTISTPSINALTVKSKPTKATTNNKKSNKIKSKKATSKPKSKKNTDKKDRRVKYKRK